MILDTNALSDLFAGNESLRLRLEDADRLSLPVIVIGEFLFGLERSRHRELLLELLRRLERDVAVLAVDRGTAERYAAIRGKLRARGRPIPENDIWIAALALQRDLPLLTRDRHFDDVEGLRRISW